MAFQGNLHLLSKSDFFLLETEMLKLRDGRDQALFQVDAELAAEEERAGSQRERRRRVSNRSNSRPGRGRSEEPESIAIPTPAPADESEQPATEEVRANGRGRRNARQRTANRRPATPPSPRYDND